MRRLFALMLCMTLVLGMAAAAQAQTEPQPAPAQVRPRNLAESPYPQSIRVAIRESRPGGEPDPRGRIIWVKTVSFDEYQRDVLPNEWLPSWHPEALKSGAIAVKMFAWYHSLYGTVADGFRYDVDNTVNFQTYREGRRTDDTNRAIAAVRPMAYVEQDGTITPTYYRAGRPRDPNWQYRNRNKMAQWGTQFHAERGRTYLEILQWYYQGKLLTRISGL